MSSIEVAMESIKVHEGLRLMPYLCPAGKYTIGYGRNLDDVGISKSEATHLLTNDIQRCCDDLETFDWFHELTENRQAAMIDMRYNLGPNRFRQFQKMIQAIEDGAYDQAAKEMLDSRWAEQVGQRAETLADMMRKG